MKYLTQMVPVLALLQSIIHISIQQDPTRAYDGYVPVDATNDNLTVPMTIMIDYTTSTTGTESNALNLHVGKACYHEDPYSEKLNDTVPGTYYRWNFTTGSISKVTLLGPFQPEPHGSPLQLHMKWTDYTGGSNYSDLLTAIKNSDIYNVSITLNSKDPARQEALQCVNKNEKYRVAKRLCSHNETYYTSILSENPKYNAIGDCEIKFSTQIEYYISMWTESVEQSSEFRKRCLGTISGLEYADYQANPKFQADYPAFFPCHKKYNTNLPNCTDVYNENRFFANALGDVTKIQIGRSNESLDLNLTINMKLWTLSLPSALCEGFKNCDLSNLKLTMDIFVKDVIIVPEREVPFHFWLIVFISIFPLTVLAAAAIFCICSRTKLGFNEDVWKYKEKKAEIQEQRVRSKTMRRERQKQQQYEETNAEVNEAKEEEEY